LAGFFTVFGIAVRTNGSRLFNRCRRLEREEGETFGPALVLRGAGERLSPILMTSHATGLALAPLVVLGDGPGNEIEYPAGHRDLGGLFASTPAQPVRRAVAAITARQGSQIRGATRRRSLRGFP
jgi:Cu/Ag efflux pump CusA